MKDHQKRFIISVWIKDKEVPPIKTDISEEAKTRHTEKRVEALAKNTILRDLPNEIDEIFGISIKTKVLAVRPGSILIFFEVLFAGYYAISRYKSFVESLELIKSQCQRLLAFVLKKEFQREFDIEVRIEVLPATISDIELQILLTEYTQGREDLRQKYRHYAVALSFYASGAAALGAYSLSNEIFFTIFTAFVLVLMTVIVTTIFSAYLIKNYLEWIEIKLNSIVKEDFNHRMLWVNTILPKHMGRYLPAEFFYSFGVVVFLFLTALSWIYGTFKAYDAIIVNHYILTDRLRAQLAAIYAIASISYGLTLTFSYISFIRRARRKYPQVDELLAKYKTEHESDL